MLFVTCVAVFKSKSFYAALAAFQYAASGDWEFVSNFVYMQCTYFTIHHGHKLLINLNRNMRNSELHFRYYKNY